MIESANKAANEHSVRFEKDEDLDAIFILVNSGYVSETISLESSTVDQVSKSLDLFVRNAEALSTIDRDFNHYDFFKVEYDRANFDRICIRIRIKEVLIEIFLHSSDRINVTASVNLAYANGRVLIGAGRLTYEVSLYDSYDCFGVSAFVGEECSIDRLNQTIDRLTEEIAKTDIIEED